MTYPAKKQGGILTAPALLYSKAVKLVIFFSFLKIKMKFLKLDIAKFMNIAYNNSKLV